jgi:hypothetical protein
MKFIKSKRGIALIAAIVAVAAVAFGAYAYFTTTGSGTGDTTAGTNTQTITLHATISGAIVPGDGGQAVTFTGDNPNTDTSLRVRTISFASVSSSDLDCQAVIDNGDPGQFSMANVTSDTTIPKATNGYTLAGTGTLVWADSASQDQTDCAGAPLTLHVTSN